jgi:hypothetical protein
MKEMRKVEMTYLSMSEVVAKYKSSQNICHCKIHIIAYVRMFTKYISSSPKYKPKAFECLLSMI